MTRVLLAMAVVAMLALSARAQVLHGQDTVKYRPVTTIDLGDVTLKGTPEKPPHVWVNEPGRAHFRSLIQYRANFDPELQGSAAKL